MQTSSWVEGLEPRVCLSTVYYVSSAIGNDDNPGTSRSAPLASIQHAVQLEVSGAGDSIVVMAGRYEGFAVGMDGGPDSGTKDHPTVYRGEPGAIIDRANPKTGKDGINIESSSWIVVQGFTIQPAATEDAWRAGIRFGGTGVGNVARNNRVLMRGVDKLGIFSSFNEQQIVQSNEVSGVWDAGIYCANSAVNPTVRDNYVHDLNNSVYGVGLHFNGDGTESDPGYIVGGTIENNRVINVNTGISMDGMQNATVQGNYLFNIHGKGINLYKENASAGSSGNSVLGNTVFMAVDAYAGIGVRYGAVNTRVMYNLVSPGANALAVLSDGESTTGTQYDFNTYATGAVFTLDNDDSRISAGTWRASRDRSSSVTGTFTRMAADVTHDGKVNGDDFAVVDANYGRIAIGAIAGDTTGDGRVNLDDYALLDAAI